MTIGTHVIASREFYLESGENYPHPNQVGTITDIDEIEYDDGPIKVYRVNWSPRINTRMYENEIEPLT